MKIKFTDTSKCPVHGQKNTTVKMFTGRGIVYAYGCGCGVAKKTGRKPHHYYFLQLANEAINE